MTFPLKMVASEGIPPDSLMILGEPDPIVLAPGQTEPTVEQVSKAYARTSSVITNIAREPRLEDYVSVPVISPAAYAIVRRALDEAERRTGAIAPASVEKITAAQRFAVDMPSAKPEEWGEPLRPSPLMRRLGYTAHPSTCTHHRKRLMLGATRWTCADCGDQA